MPIKLTVDEQAFLERAELYCREGLTQEQMAREEGMSLGGFRGKLRDCGFEIEALVERRVVRLRTGETVPELLARGELVTVAPDAEPIAA